LSTAAILLTAIVSVVLYNVNTTNAQGNYMKKNQLREWC